MPSSAVSRYRRSSPVTMAGLSYLHLRSVGVLWVSVLGAGMLGGCTPQLDASAEDSTVAELNRVPKTVRVNGRDYDVETEYLPRVVMCENPWAPAESLRAQAIAARTFVTYKYVVEKKTSIKDGESDQVFTCPANKSGSYVSADVRQAVSATIGQIVLHGTDITVGFFAQGALRDASCAAGSDGQNTERYVTINVNRTGDEVIRRPNGQYTNLPGNRGGLGQNLANCLAARDGLNAGQILAYFYGADITIRGADPVATVPSPTENDPAVQPVAVAMPVLMDPLPSTNDPTCFSYTLAQTTGQTHVAVGECVQSLADNAWWQCLGTGSFGKVTGAGEGPAGPCTVEHSL